MASQKPKPDKIQGYMYVSAKSDLKLLEAPVGTSYVKTDRKPPWLVVHHSLDSILVTRWPGRLLKVEVRDQDNEKDINQGLVKDIWYTRTVGIHILEELTADALFQPDGTNITNILDFACALTKEQVGACAQFETLQGSKIYSDAWNRWLETKDPTSIHLHHDHFNTLAIFAKNRRTTLSRSFSTISNIVHKRAKEVLGDKAHSIDEDGEYILNSAWSHASTLLFHAAMAYCAKTYTTNKEQAVLLAPWKAMMKISKEA